MKNIPNKIYLNVGEIDDDVDFKDLTQVSWSDKKIDKNDIEFVHNPDRYFDLILERCENIIRKYNEGRLVGKEIRGLKVLLGKY